MIAQNKIIIRLYIYNLIIRIIYIYFLWISSFVVDLYIKPTHIKCIYKVYKIQYKVMTSSFMKLWYIQPSSRKSQHEQEMSCVINYAWILDFRPILRWPYAWNMHSCVSVFVFISRFEILINPFGMKQIYNVLNLINISRFLESTGFLWLSKVQCVWVS